MSNMETESERDCNQRMEEGKEKEKQPEKKKLVELRLSLAEVLGLIILFLQKPQHNNTKETMEME